MRAVVTTIHIGDETTRVEWEFLLRAAGIPGPWSAGEGGLTLSVSEAEGMTVVTTSPRIPRSQVLRVKGLHTRRITVRLIDPGWAGPRPLFPLREISWSQLDPTSLHDAKTCCEVADSGRTPVGLWGDLDGFPALVLGWQVSEQLRRSRSAHDFFGYGHVVTLLRSFLFEKARLGAITVDPWPSGKIPLVVSLDVEGHVPRRSVGRRLFRLAVGSKSVEANWLRLGKPLVTRRLIPSVNTLNDPDGRHKSYRLTIDPRFSRRNKIAKSWWVPQLQVHINTPEPGVRPAEPDGFLHCAGRDVGPHTAFVTGADPPISDGAIGFHGVTHTHFNMMSEDQLRRELGAARRWFPPDAPVVVRAPGLLWSDRYFSVLHEFGVGADSSFREANYLQPTTPVRSVMGWWEIPVTANVFNIPDFGALVTNARRYRNLLSLYAHDHELREEGQRQDFRASLERLGDDFKQVSVGDLAVWMEEAMQNRIESVSVSRSGELETEMNLVPQTTISLKSLGRDIPFRCSVAGVPDGAALTMKEGFSGSATVQGAD